MRRRILFARIGWMESYTGATNDPPQGQMGYIKDRKGPVAERFNFTVLGGKVYGYVTHTNGTLYNLGRIDAAGVDADYLNGVLVVFMAARPRQIGAGQCVVGWYRDARLYDDYKPTPHLTTRTGSIYCAVASPREAFLLPVPIRTWEIPTGPGGMGQTKIRYFDPRQRWMRQIITQIDHYSGPSVAEASRRKTNLPRRRMRKSVSTSSVDLPPTGVAGPSARDRSGSH